MKSAPDPNQTSGLLARLLALVVRDVFVFSLSQSSERPETLSARFETEQRASDAVTIVPRTAYGRCRPPLRRARKQLEIAHMEKTP